MNLGSFSLRDLEYVVAVADLGSFVRAAEHCRVAQPSLSSQVRKVERNFGAAIFERTRKGVWSTVPGGIFISQARKVLAEARILLATPHQTAQPFDGKLHLSAIATLGPYLFPLMLGPLRRARPRLSLVLGEGLTEDLLGGLVGGSLDAVLLSAPQNGPTLEMAPLFQESFVLACPRGHPAELPDGPRWEDLEPDDRLVLDEGHCLREQAISACASIAARNRHATSLETLKYMVAAGEGCTLVPALAAAETGAISYARSGSPTLKRLIGLAWRRSDPRSADFQKLAMEIRCAVASSGADVHVVNMDGLQGRTPPKRATSAPLQAARARPPHFGKVHCIDAHSRQTSAGHRAGHDG